MKIVNRLSRGPELPESLGRVIGHLHQRAGGRAGLESSAALLGSADVFLDRLADHITEQEGSLFPAFSLASSDTIPGFKRQGADHATLSSAARRLVVRMLKGDDVLDSARVLLVQLLQHIRSEGMAGSAYSRV